MRVVLDSNVLLSGLMYPDGTPGRIVRAWREGRFDLVISLQQIEEIGRTLAYPKIRKVLGWDEEAIGRFLRQIYLRAEMIELAGEGVAGLRDPDDAPLIETLARSGAEALVTGDRDLLVLADRYRVETPSEFARRL